MCDTSACRSSLRRFLSIHWIPNQNALQTHVTRSIACLYTHSPKKGSCVLLTWPIIDVKHSYTSADRASSSPTAADLSAVALSPILVRLHPLLSPWTRDRFSTAECYRVDIYPQMSTTIDIMAAHYYLFASPDRTWKLGSACSLFLTLPSKVVSVGMVSNVRFLRA